MLRSKLQRITVFKGKLSRLKEVKNRSQSMASGAKFEHALSLKDTVLFLQLFQQL